MVKFNRLLPVAVVTSLAFLAPGVAKAQLSETDRTFVQDIKSYGQEHGTAFSNVSDRRHIETAKTICDSVQQQGAGTSFKQFVSKVRAENVDQGEAKALGYMFASSVQSYCPQYANDLKQYYRKKFNIKPGGSY